MKKRVLFVDNEASILDVLRYMLKNMLPEWEKSFAKSEREALDLMGGEAFDVVICDADAPGPDVVELLSKVKKEFPHVVHIGFSTDYDQKAINRLIGSTNQFLLKPDDLSQIRDTIIRAFSLRSILSEERLKNVISKIKTLPSLPELYYQVVSELQSPYPSLEKVGNIINQDMAMNAKLLQIVNSAFFGLRHHVSNPIQAASLLGIDILRSLVLVMHIFTEQNNLSVDKFTLKTLWTHSLSVAVISQDIALQEDVEKKSTDDAFIGGLLHDLGKLVLMANMTQLYGQVLLTAREQNLPLSVVEKDKLGASHAEVGAYLLGLWCFSESLIQACAFHHEPNLCRDQSFGPLTTVHVANVFDHQTHSNNTCGYLPCLDMDYLSSLGLAERIPAWRSHHR
jgi:HD-like signal output (HDOD) protein